MNQIYEISFNYYVHFYSYKGKLSKLWPWMLITFTSAVLFVYLSLIGFNNLDSYKSRGLLFYWDMRWIFLSELVFLSTLFKMQSVRNSLLTNGYKNFSKKYQLIIAKRNWIKLNFNKSENEYFQLSKDIREMHDLHKKYARKIWTWGEFFSRYIYNPDANGRITSYFIFLMSLISLVTIKSIENLSSLLPTLTDSSYQKFVILLMIDSIFIFLILVGFLQLIKFIFTTIDTTISILTSSKRSSYKFVEVLIGDLITMHRLPKDSLGNTANEINPSSK